VPKQTNSKAMNINSFEIATKAAYNIISEIGDRFWKIEISDSQIILYGRYCAEPVAMLQNRGFKFENIQGGYAFFSSEKDLGVLVRIILG